MSVVQQRPLRLPMDPKLLQAARSGDKRNLDELLEPQEVSSRASMEAIRVPEDAATQIDTSVLLGVTPEGNTALHIVASLGHRELAGEICQREISLLAAPNTMLDTPLHCAAKAGDPEMVSLLIQFAGEDEIEARRVLRARNWDEANALHEAAKYAHVRVAEVLMEMDSGLASMLNGAGMSPLYLAVVTGSFDVVEVLLRYSSREMASPTFYAGPNNRTALHAAVFLSLEMTEHILKQDPMLIKCVDSLGRNPLHYVAICNHGDMVKRGDMVKLLLDCDPSAAYQEDDNGSFPIHIAARMGHIATVELILQQCPAAEQLLDKKKGRNFLHVAFQYNNLDIVKKIISKRPHLRKLLNEQDNKGNTPLHTAVKKRDLQGVHFLLRDKSIQVNIMNYKGWTPLDSALSKMEVGDLAFLNIEVGVSVAANASVCVFSCLAFSEALFGPCALDRLRPVNVEQIEKELEAFKNIGISSVLITAVTFAAGFTFPGGYIAEDYPNVGTAVLAKEYTFKVFVISNAFALVCSALATSWLVTTSAADHRTRRRVLSAALLCLKLAMIGMFAAFVMGLYVVLARRCRTISILLCFMALGGPLFSYAVIYRDYYCSLRAIAVRQGYKSLIYPAFMHPLAKRYLPSAFVRLGAIIDAVILICGTYALFFLIAMIKY